MRYVYHRHHRHARHWETDDCSPTNDARHARHWPERIESTDSETETPRDHGSENDTESDFR
jgi:hypothetical protein